MDGQPGPSPQASALGSPCARIRTLLPSPAIPLVTAAVGGSGTVVIIPLVDVSVGLFMIYADLINLFSYQKNPNGCKDLRSSYVL